MHSVKKVKKVLTKTLPRYYLRSRKRYAPLFRPVVSVADQETQADLSDEDREALFAELPFHFLSSPESDTEGWGAPKYESKLYVSNPKFKPSSKFIPTFNRILYPHSRRSYRFWSPRYQRRWRRRILCAPGRLWRTTSRHTHTPDLSRTIVSAQPILHWTFKGGR